MAVPNVFSNGTVADADEVNANFAWTGLVPVGTVLPWLKSLTNTPALDDRFVECNGQTLSDAESVYNGVVIPNLNGAVDTGLKGYFLRGHSSSGVIESSQNLAHTHTIGTTNTNYNLGNAYAAGSASTTGNATSSSNGGAEARPHNYSVVYIMRVK